MAREPWNRLGSLRRGDRGAAALGAPATAGSTRCSTPPARATSSWRWNSAWPADRIDTIADFGAVQKYGVKADGAAAAAAAAVLGELAGLAADGELEVPIAATYPLDEVREAYRALAEEHPLGKIVLMP